jgi:hypothetical protein
MSSEETSTQETQEEQVTTYQRETEYEPTLSLRGCWVVTQNGTVSSLGDAPHLGSFSESELDLNARSIASALGINGYWLLAQNGSVYSYGDVRSYVLQSDTPLENAVDIAATPSGDGYIVVNKMGQIKTYGSAEYLGSGLDFELNSEVVAIDARQEGYWILTESGRVLNFGRAEFLGSGSEFLEEGDKFVDIIAHPSGEGYWLITAKGKVVSFGLAQLYGSVDPEELQSPVQAGVSTPQGDGYWLICQSGRLYPFGTASAFETASVNIAQGDCALGIAVAYF